MDMLRACLRSVSAIGARKLGRCPRCIRFAARGAGLGWVVALSLRVVWSTSAAVGLAVLVATAFTVVLLAHLVIYTWRMALRAFAERMPANRGADASRRRFIVQGMGLALYAVGAALWGFGRVVIAADDCTGIQDVDDDEVIEVVKESTETTRREALRLLSARCIELEVCGAKSCDAGFECVDDRRAAPRFTLKAREQHRVGETWRVVLTGCPCTCAESTGGGLFSTVKTVIALIRALSNPLGFFTGSIVFETFLSNCSSTAGDRPTGSASPNAVVVPRCRISMNIDLTKVVFHRAAEGGHRPYRGISTIGHTELASALPTSFVVSGPVQFVPENGAGILNAIARIRGRVLGNGRVADDIEIEDLELLD